MEKRRIIININGNIKDSEAIDRVAQVISKGKISQMANGKPHYCLGVVFQDGTSVSVTPKYWSENEIFNVTAKTRKKK